MRHPIQWHEARRTKTVLGRGCLLLGWGLILAAGCGGEPEATPESGTSAGEPATPAPTEEPAAPAEPLTAADPVEPIDPVKPVEPIVPAQGEFVADPVVAEVPTPTHPPVEPAAADVGSPPPPISAPQRTALDAARALRAEGRQQEAAAALRAAEKEHGEHALLRLEAGWCFQEMAETAFREGGDKFFVKGNLADAKLRVDQAQALHADLPGAVALLARNLLWSEDPDGARELLTAHLEKHPKDLAARLEAASLEETFRNWESADTHLTRAVEIAPDRGDLVLRGAIAKQWTQAYPVAKLRGLYLRAAELLPDEHRPVDLLIALYRGRDDRIAAADAVIAANANATWARVWKAHLLRQPDADGMTDLEGAIAVLDEAIAVAPDDFELHFQRGSALLEAGETEKAFDEYLISVELAPESNAVPASNALDQALFATPPGGFISLETRERAYAALVAKNPTDGAYGNNAGLWYRDKGKDYEKSLKWYLSSVAVNPDDQDYLNDCALIWLFHLRDEKEKCLPMFEKVIRLVEEDEQEPKRGYWDALENLCKYHTEIGEYQKVVDYAAKRANPAASLNGRPYPSLRAAQFAAKAMAELAKERGD